MQNDFSYINSEADLDRAVQTVNERLASTRQQIKVNSQQLPGALRQVAIRKSLPWIAGAAGVVIGTLLIRKWRQRPLHREAVISKSPVSKFASAEIPRSLALQLLPIATVLFKKWLANRNTARKVVDE